MFNSGFFVRLLVAAVVVFVFWQVLPAFLRLIHMTVNGDLTTVITWVVAACAVFYVFFGKQPPLSA